MTIGEKIKNMRQELGYTQEQLANKLLVSRQAIAKWESDRGVPDIENLKTIAKFFDLSVDYLVNDDSTLTQEGVLDSGQNLDEEMLQNEVAEEQKDLKNQLSDILKNKKIFVPFICVLIGLVSVLVIFSCVVPIVKQNANMKKAKDLGMSYGPKFQRKAHLLYLPFFFFISSFHYAMAGNWAEKSVL